MRQQQDIRVVASPRKAVPKVQASIEIVELVKYKNYNGPTSLFPQ